MPSSFVTAQGTHFELNQKQFEVSGFNCYFLAYCSDPSRRAALASAKNMGATVVRSWAFLAKDDFSSGDVAFQSFKGGRMLVHDGPDGLHRLDALIKAAEDFDLKLILPLVNHWDALGGMLAYVKGLAPHSADVTEFYRAPALRAAYREWVGQLLTRRNTITGRLYSEEPAIMAWELTNEARCQVRGGSALLLDWVEEMSAFVKQHDPNHLLALGDEGFFYKKGSGHLYNGTYGVDWEANLSIKSMDFGSYHFYPQDWGYLNDPQFAQRWITDHSEIAARLNKPVILEEYGLKATPDRDRIYAEWQNCMRETGTAGSLVWMLGHKSTDTVGYVDDYVIYEQDQPAAANREAAG